MPPRHTRPTDSNKIKNPILAAFGKDEALKLLPRVDGLLNALTDPPVISLVSADHDQIDGFVAFSPVFPELGSGVRGYILAPLALSPPHQRPGIDSLLVRHGLALLAENNADLVLVYGNPHYYGGLALRGRLQRPFSCLLKWPIQQHGRGCC